MYKRNNKLFATAIIAVISMCLTSGGAMAGGALAVDFDAGNFDPSMMSNITNPYWPLTPPFGVRTFTYVGDNDDECVINTISIDQDNTRSDFAPPYNTIVAQVVEDREWLVELGENEECNENTPISNADLTELTFDWYAQDIHQNVWYMGELSQSFEDECGPHPGTGVPECFEGSWEAGQYGLDMEIKAEPGIVVPSDTPYGHGGEPLTPGTYYMQEVAEGAEDMAKILRLNAPLTVEDGVFPGEYENCRKVKEWTSLEPGGSVEHKWYCSPGPGLVLIQGIGGGTTESEVLMLVTP